MQRVNRVLMLVAVLLCGALLAACSADERDQIAQTLERAAKATEGLGQHITSTGSVSVDGQRMRLSSRAAIAADGRHARISSRMGALTFEQYLDGNAILMSVDSLPAGGPWPADTRWLRFDLDTLGRGAGVDSTLRDLQTLDPAKAAAMLSKVAEDVTSRRGKVRGVAVTRYSARVPLDKLMRSLFPAAASGESLEPLEGAALTVEVAIDDDDRIRGFATGGVMGPMTMEMRGEVTAFERGLKIAIPSRGVHDISDAIAGLAGALTPPRGP